MPDHVPLKSAKEEKKNGILWEAMFPTRVYKAGWQLAAMLMYLERRTACVRSKARTSMASAWSSKLDRFEQAALAMRSTKVDAGTMAAA